MICPSHLILLLALIWEVDSKYSLAFQLLNYSNPYFRLNIADEEYRCLYSYHTWQPKRLEHFKCRFIFTVLVSPGSSNDPAFLSTTKIISLPADGDHKGTIDFTRDILLDKCSMPVKCVESTWRRPVHLKFATKPKWIRVLVQHIGSLVADSTDRLVTLNQNFLVDDFFIDLDEHGSEYYVQSRIRNRKLLTSLAYLAGMSCNFCEDASEAQSPKVPAPLTGYVQRCELMKKETFSYQLTTMILLILCLTQAFFLCMKFCSSQTHS